MEQSHPKVSVIIPIYGVEKYIERCAISLFEQTLEDIEFIFVDDCTPDRSMEILNLVIEKYRHRLSEEKKNVRIERMPVNSGLPAVRRYGLQIAMGDYVIHCDSDDWVDTNMYRAMYERAVEDDADVVVCDFIETDGIHREWDKRKKGCHNVDNMMFLENIFYHRDSPSVWNKMFKKSVYSTGIFFPNRFMAEDLTVTVQLLWSCNRISYVPQVLYYYYINPLSASHIQSKEACIRRFEESVENIKNVNAFYRDKTLAKRFKAGLIAMKEYERSRILPLIKERIYYKKWKAAFPENNRQILWNKYVSLKRKYIFLLILLHLYPIYVNRKN